MMKTLATVGWTKRFLPVALLMFNQACVDDDPAQPQRAQDLDTGEAAPGFEDLGESQLMVDLAREIPGLGGVYYEPGGEQLVIAMTEANLTGFPVARQAVLSHLVADVSAASMADIPPTDFVERVVKYSFVELARHRARLRPRLFIIPEVMSLAVDEEFNRIAIGLEDLSARTAVLNAAGQLAVPAEVLFFSIASPTRVHISLTAPELPFLTTNTLHGASPDGKLRGGYQVQADGKAECTLGFTARTRTRAATPVLVVNSHCSKCPFKFDRGDWGQPDTATIVGYEMRDPPTRRCWKRLTRQSCRESDAALVITNANTTIAFGEIVRPQMRHHRTFCPTGCLAINSDNPTIPIRSGSKSILDNEELDKIGRSTGWTYGDVKETCDDRKGTDGVWRLCSDVVDFYSDLGDSGAPVFQYLGEDAGEGEAVLKGIHWGSGDDGSVVSDFGQIKKDLGGLWVHDPGPPVVHSLYGPAVVPPDHVCLWRTVVWGMYPFHHYWSGVLTEFKGTVSDIWGVVKESGWLKVKGVDILDRSATDSMYVTVWDDMPSELLPAGCAITGGGPGGG